MNGGDDRRSKNDTWTKGGGGVRASVKKSDFNFRDNKRTQK